MFVRWELSAKHTYRERECVNLRVCVCACMHICVCHDSFVFLKARECICGGCVMCGSVYIYVGVCMCVDVSLHRARQCGCFPKVSAPFHIRADKSNPAGNMHKTYESIDDTPNFSRHSIHAQTRSNLAGTPRYMAPEAYRDEKCTEKIDIYSLAMMMWEMLTSQLPWDGSNFQVCFCL